MSDIFFGPAATWFTVPALLGTVFFVLRLGMMFIGGGDMETDFDAGDVGDVDTDLDGGDSEAAFKVLSIQSIAAFMMGFGWGGIGALRGGGWTLFTSTLFAFVAGSAMVWVLAKLLMAIYRLQSSGNIGLDAALGLEGTASTAIPAAGGSPGQVRVVIDDRERFVRAVSEGGELPSRTRVRVVRVNDDNSVTVEPMV